MKARFGERPAESITPQDVERFLAAGIEQDKWAPPTANRYRALLSLTYQSGVVRTCSAAERGIGVGFANEFWALGLMLTPVAFGAIAERYSLELAFQAAGITAIALAVVTIPAVPWLLRAATAPARSVSGPD